MSGSSPIFGWVVDGCEWSLELNQGNLFLRFYAMDYDSRTWRKYKIICDTGDRIRVSKKLYRNGSWGDYSEPYMSESNSSEGEFLGLICDGQKYNELRNMMQE